MPSQSHWTFLILSHECDRGLAVLCLHGSVVHVRVWILTLRWHQQLARHGAPPNRVQLSRNEAAPEVTAAVMLKAFISQQGFVSWRQGMLNYYWCYFIAKCQVNVNVLFKIRYWVVEHKYEAVPSDYGLTVNLVNINPGYVWEVLHPSVF